MSPPRICAGLHRCPGSRRHLSADRFTPPGHEDKSHWLPKQPYAAAFLAAERAGMLRLEVRSKKALLGLRTVQALYADPTGGAGAFPAESLESTLCKQAASLAKKNRHDVRSVAADLILGASVDPWSSALYLVQDALGARGLLTATQQKALKFIKVVKYSTPEQTAPMAEEQASEVQGLLHGTQDARPDLWKRLIDEIDSGIRSRKQDTSTPDFG